MYRYSNMEHLSTVPYRIPEFRAGVPRGRQHSAPLLDPVLSGVYRNQQWRVRIALGARWVRFVIWLR